MQGHNIDSVGDIIVSTLNQYWYRFAVVTWFCCWILRQWWYWFLRICLDVFQLSQRTINAWRRHGCGLWCTSFSPLFCFGSYIVHYFNTLLISFSLALAMPRWCLPLSSSSCSHLLSNSSPRRRLWRLSYPVALSAVSLPPAARWRRRERRICIVWSTRRTSTPSAATDFKCR